MQTVAKGNPTIDLQRYPLQLTVWALSPSDIGKLMPGLDTSKVQSGTYNPYSKTMYNKPSRIPAALYTMDKKIYKIK